MAKVTTKSLVLDLLSTLKHGSMPVRALVEAGALFDVSENSVRVTLARLRAAGTVARDDRGRYSLGAKDALGARVRTWRQAPRRVGAWDGSWIGALTDQETTRRAARRSPHARALRMMGLRPFERGLHLRPANLVGGVVATRNQLQSLGLDRSAQVFVVSELSAEDDQRARRLWDGDRLEQSYRETVRRLERSMHRRAKRRTKDAMVETFLLGGDAIRQVVADPLLPEPIVAADARRELIAATRAYDRFGREQWAPFLRRHDVPHREAPADLRVGTHQIDLPPTRSSPAVRAGLDCA